MVKRALLFVLCALAGCAVAAATAGAKGVGVMTAAGGVTVSGSHYRYVAIAPGPGNKLTLVERIDRRGGKVGRWWYLRGGYYVPAVAYDRSGGGLSADGSTLVLSRFSAAYPPRTTRLAILDTRLYLRHPRRPGQQRPSHAFTYIDLEGDFSFDAISPDGSTVYLIHRYLSPRAGAAYISTYEVRALDTESGRLLPGRIVDPEEPHERMEGVPITRATSPDGRWAYTLYDGNGKTPFIHALDTVGRGAVCIDLPLLEDLRNPFMLRLRMERGGQRLAVLSRPPGLGGSQRLLSVDTKTLDIGGADPKATIADRGTPWGMLDGLLSGMRKSLSARGFLAFATTPPRRPGNVLLRAGVAGRSAEGKRIRLRQLGDPALDGEVLVFGCIHGNECAARGLEPLTNGCPDPHADIYLVPNLNPDGAFLGTRLNGRGVDLNRNFPAGWKSIGERGDPQYSGPRPFSEPEARLAARIVRRVRPAVTIWFHQHYGPRPLVRAWGQSAPAARRFARLARLPFHLLPWPAGTAPNWQNHRFPGAGSFVVELPPGPLSEDLESRLDSAIVRLGQEVSED